MLALAYLGVEMPQNAMSGFQSSGIRPYNRNIFWDTGYASASIIDGPYNDCTSASPTHPPLSELPQ
jgi:hypothetical protein